MQLCPASIGQLVPSFQRTFGQLYEADGPLHPILYRQ